MHSNPPARMSPSGPNYRIRLLGDARLSLDSGMALTDPTLRNSDVGHPIYLNPWPVLCRE